MEKTVSLCIKICMVGFISGIFLWGAPDAGAAGKINNYSADQVMTDPHGRVVSQGRLYVRPDRMRMDTTPPEGGGEMIIIFRKDLKLNWMLNPRGKTYFERPLDEKEMKKTMQQITQGTKEKVLGTEKVGGFNCTKKQVKTTTQVMGFTSSTESIIWVSDKLDMPIRTRSSDGSTSELKNIKKGAPAKSYFEIPKGYRKVTNMMELFAADATGEAVDAPEDPAFPLKIPKGFKFPFGGNSK